MLANWKAKYIVGVGEFETIAKIAGVIFEIYDRQRYVTLQCLEKPDISSPGETPSTCWGPRVWDELLFIRKK